MYLDGTRLKSIFTWELPELPGASGTAQSILVRHGLDKSQAVTLAAGARVFACDNGVITGEIVLKHKHVPGVGRWLDGLGDKLYGLLDNNENDIYLARDRTCIPSELFSALVERKIASPLMARRAAEVWASEEHLTLHGPRDTIWSWYQAVNVPAKTLAPLSQARVLRDAWRLGMSTLN